MNSKNKHGSIVSLLILLVGMLVFPATAQTTDPQVGFRPSLTINGYPCAYPHMSCGEAITCPQTVCAGEPLNFCTITVPPGQQMPPWDITQSYCSGQYILWTFTGSSNYPNPILNNASNTPAGQELCFSPVWNTPGTYNVHVKFEGPCNDCATHPPGNIYEWVIPVTVTGASVQVSSTPATCYGGSNGTATATITNGNPPYTFIWSPSGQTTATATGLTAGTYTVQVSDQLSCTTSVTVNVGQPAPIVVNTTSASVCSGVTAQLSATASQGVPPYSYQWSPNTNLTAPTNSTTSVLNPTVTTTYTITATDANGCIGTGTASVNIIPAPPASITGSESSCNKIEVYNATSNPNYSYNWSISPSPITWSGQGTSTITVDWSSSTNSTNTITLVVTDNTTGCTSTVSYVVGSCCKFEQANAYNFYNTSVTNIPSIATQPGWFTFAGGTYFITNKQFSINGTFTVNQNLTLQGCEVKMGYNAKIIVSPGVKFIVTNSSTGSRSHLYSCNEMWNGSYVDGTNPASNIIINNGSTVQDALNAIVSTNGGRFEIYTTTANKVQFNKNFKNIVVQSYGGQHPAFIRQAEFTCADNAVLLYSYQSTPANTLRYPKIGQRTHIGVELTDVANFPNIGNPSLTAYKNRFSNMNYGVYALRSEYKVQNNEFLSITGTTNLCKGCGCPIGTAVCAEGQVNNPKTVTVGGTTALMGNKFQNCGYGIFTRDYIMLNARKNTFNFISSTAIEMFNSPNLNGIHIVDNDFDNFIIGIGITGIPGTMTIIDQNRFNFGLFPAQNQPFPNTAIRVQNTFPAFSNLIIQNNDIKRIRMGIVVSNVYQAQIVNNNPIWITGTVTASSPRHIGIWTQNCRNVTIRDNFIKRIGQNPTASLIDILQGIRLEKCPTSIVSENTVQRMGSGIRCVGNNPTSDLSCNLLEKCYYGFKMGENAAATDIGTQLWGGQETGNFWDNNPNVGSFRIQGLVSPAVNWHSGAAGNYYVDGGNTSTAGLSYPFGTPNSCTAGTPPQLAPIVDRETKFGAIVRDEKIFIDHIPERKTWDKAITYKIFKNDPSLLTLGGNDDATYQAFYSTVQGSNTGKLVDVQDHIASGNLSAAASLNATVSGTDVMEINKKMVNDIYLSTWAIGNYEFTPADQATLQSIADQLAIEGGDAVYTARVMLGLEIHEEVASSLREQNETGIEETADPALYPNPSNGEANLQYSLTEGQTGTFELFDMLGNKIAAYQLTDSENVLTFSTKDIAAGIYLYKVTISGTLVKADKFIVVK